MTIIHSFIFLLCLIIESRCQTINVPFSAPPGAVAVDPALLSVSLEFFAFPGYMSLNNTAPCLDQLQASHGHAPAVRIGGTTQFVFRFNIEIS